MKDKYKTKEQLLDELKTLRDRVDDLERLKTEHKQMESRLKSSEKRLRTLFEFAPDAYYLNGLEGNFIEANRAAEEITGDKKEELIGKSFLKLTLLPPEQIPKAAALLAQNAVGEPTGPDEFVLNRKDGNQVTVEVSTFPVKIESQPVVLGIARDITDRKRVEEALRESEERYALTTRAGEVGVWDWNLETNEIYLDPNLKAMLGYADHEIRNHLDDWGKFVHPGDAEQVMEEANAHLDGLTPQYEIAHRMLHKDGSIRWFLARGIAMRDANGKPYRMLGTDTDITERKWAEEELRKHREHLEELVEERTAELCATNEQLAQKIAERKQVEEALRESEEKYRLVVENANQTIVVVQDWSIKFVNRQAKEILGYPVEEIISRPFLEFAHPDDRALLAERHQKRLKGEDLPHVYSFRVIGKNGDVRWLEMNSVSISWEGGPATLNFLSDITERKRLEQQILQARKMEAIATLAGGVAHEFNNALGAILGRIDLLKRERHDDERISECIESVDNTAQWMAHLTNQLLAYARRGKYLSKVISLSDFVKDTLPLVRRTIDSTIRVETDLAGGISTVEADPTQMRMVLSTVLTNSAEAMDGAGRIRIITEEKQIDGEVAKGHPGLKAGRYACLTIEDDGKGMDEKTRSRIFEPFFTTKFHGRGLGMAAAYGIVKNHGGWISVDSELGKGTVVRIYLPATEIQAKEAKKSRTELAWGDR